ncbi:hypothetical protein [Calothrix sp. NIES-2100]
MYCGECANFGAGANLPLFPSTLSPGANPQSLGKSEFNDKEQEYQT